MEKGALSGMWISLIVIVFIIVVILIGVFVFYRPYSANSNQAGASDGVLQLTNNSVVGAAIWTDSKGMTLYTFALDQINVSNCYGACAVAWPPMLVAQGTTPTGDPGLSTITRTDGKIQITYDGSPVYYYQGDVNPGNTNGNNLNAFGGLWKVFS